ncbi:MAG: hypothetical protein N3F66_14220 [Spirochaetes bacterium]|nr:hypothetical protein [Spirochaetota bacterium]
MYFEKGYINEVHCSHELSTPPTLHRRKSQWQHLGFGERPIIESRIIAGSVRHDSAK